MDINNVTLIGRLTRDSEIKEANGKSMAVFSIAVNGYKDSVSFFNCVAFDKTAEFINQYCKKGHRIAIIGKLNQKSWVDKDGGKKSTVEIVVSNVQSLTPKTDKQESFNEAMPF